MERELEMQLQEFYEEIKNCQKCPLSKTRTNLVFGVGNEKSVVMFVGEAPGYYEDKQGEPFVGAAGKLLTELLGSIGLERKDVYIGNVLKCRPPQNRNPYPSEIEACKPYLWRQIKIIKPRVVCTLGNFATQTISGKKISISNMRAKHIQIEDFFIFPLFHPAAALHRKDMLEPLKEDFKKLKEFLDSNIELEHQAEQLSLF